MPGNPSFQWTNGEGALAEAYDGPATVETSTAGQVVLTSPPDPSADGGAASLVGRLPILGANLPAFPVGAQVWLTKTQGPSQFIFEAPSPAAFAVRESRDGTLLFGANESAASASVASSTLPVDTGAVTAVCTAPGVDACASMNTSYAVVFVADTSVTLRDGERGQITLGGSAYDVWVKAWRETPICPGDAWAGDGVQYDVIATNLAALIAGLPIPPPS
jgi:hypothetical protein